ncbi:protein FAM234B isoform X2 [Pleurodeles waltl]
MISGLNPEEKVVPSVVPCLRTAAFLLTVIIAMVLVLLCAFLIPCPQKDLLSTWSLRLGQETGVTSPLDIFDVNNDGVPDILLSFSPLRNDSTQGTSRPLVTVVSLSGVNGSILWTSQIHEVLHSIYCGRLLMADRDKPTCLLTGSSKFLRLLNASSGKTIWTMSSARIPSLKMTAPAFILPDLDGDETSDLLVLLIGENQPDLSFLLVSGGTGKIIGGLVKYSILGDGKLVGPQIYVTGRGAYYVLFGLGNVQAVALRDIYAQAKNRDAIPPVLVKQDQDWEKRRSGNVSELINIYSGGVEFLQLVPASDNNCSDLLITTKHGLSLLSGQNLEPRWTLNLKNIQSDPTPGYFNEDRILDFMLQVQSGNRLKKVLVINGKTGTSIWNITVPWRKHESKAASVLTADLKSIFLYWGEEPHLASNSSFSGTDELPRYHLYLLHPNYPSVLLDLFNSTATVTATAVGVSDPQKDAFYITVTADSAQGNTRDSYRPLAVSKLGLRWAMAHSNVVSLGAVPLKIKPMEVRRILSRLKFVSQEQKF